MVARQHSEGHRQASWLELFFDLSFVVAVAQAAIELEHALAAGHLGAGLIAYFMVFAAIWWAWMAFTWFANVFDTDDVAYRLLMMIMIAGSLGLAAGVPQLAQLDFRIGVVSYVVMRLAYVAQWTRVLRTRDPTWRPVATKIIALTTIYQAGWVLFLLVPLEWRVAGFIALFSLEIATPIVAGWDERMGGHRGHMVERYGLFTIIVLGESIAAATVAVAAAINGNVAVLPLLTLAGGGLIVVFSLWWIYFDFSNERAPAKSTTARYVWGYGHYLVFAALTAIGVGLSLGVEWLSEPDHVALPDWGVAAVTGVAVATFLVTVALIESTAGSENSRLLSRFGGGLLSVVAAFAAPLLTMAGSVLLIGLVLAGVAAHDASREDRMRLRAR